MATRTAWADALRRAVHRRISPMDTRLRLEAIADRVVQLAMKGDKDAIAELGNRIDGKAKQQIEVQTDARMTLVIGSGALAIGTMDQSNTIDVDPDTSSILADEAYREDTALPPPDAYTHAALREQSVSEDDESEQDQRSIDTVRESTRERIRQALAQSTLIVPRDS